MYFALKTSVVLNGPNHIRLRIPILVRWVALFLDGLTRYVTTICYTKCLPSCMRKDDAQSMPLDDWTDAWTMAKLIEPASYTKSPLSITTR